MHIYLSQISLYFHFSCHWDFFVFICSLETFTWSFTGTSKVGVSQLTLSAILQLWGGQKHPGFTDIIHPGNEPCVLRKDVVWNTNRRVCYREENVMESVSVCLVSECLSVTVGVTSGYRLKMTPPAGRELTHHPLMSLSLPLWLYQVVSANTSVLLHWIYK